MFQVFVNPKLISQLPETVKDKLFTLIQEIRLTGPVRGNWPNYSKLGKNIHHCHLNKRGRPTYVAVWENQGREIVKITYVGTREKAPY
jgi:hypothetical protein